MPALDKIVWACKQLKSDWIIETTCAINVWLDIWHAIARTHQRARFYSERRARRTCVVALVCVGVLSACFAFARIALHFAGATECHVCRSTLAPTRAHTPLSKRRCGRAVTNETLCACLAKWLPAEILELACGARNAYPSI